MKSRAKTFFAKLTEGITVHKLVYIVIGALICTFGIHNIHQRTGITEGGILGLILLIDHWLGISPAYITPVLDALCYYLAFRFLGWDFIKLSAVATFFVSCFFKLWEMFPPMLPDLSAHPLAAAVFGGIFVGVGFGLIIRQGGSGGGDDALALTIANVFNWKLSVAYIFTDFTVLSLSLTYIPFSRIFFSLITTTISSNLIDAIKNFGRKSNNT